MKHTLQYYTKLLRYCIPASAILSVVHTFNAHALATHSINVVPSPYNIHFTHGTSYKSTALTSLQIPHNAAIHTVMLNPTRTPITPANNTPTVHTAVSPMPKVLACDPFTTTSSPSHNTVTRQEDYIHIESYDPYPKPTIDLDGYKGILASPANITGDIVATENTKLVNLNNVTLKGNISLADGENSIMINTSFIGEQNKNASSITVNNGTTVETITYYTGSNGSISAGAGNDVIWISAENMPGIPTIGTYTGSSTIFGDIAMGEGKNTLKITSHSHVQGDITFGSGDDSLYIDYASIGILVRDPYNSSMALLQNGNINLGNGNNTVAVENGLAMAGTLTSGTGNDSIELQYSTIHGALHDTGGNNSITIRYSDVVQGIQLGGGDDNVLLNSAFIGLRAPHTSSAEDTFATIDLGSGNNTLTMQYMTFKNTIKGDGTLILDNSQWQTPLYKEPTADDSAPIQPSNDSIVLNESLEVNMINGSSLAGTFVLENNNSTLYVSGGYFLNDFGNGVGALHIGANEKNTEVSYDRMKALVAKGNIDVDAITLEKDYLLSLGESSTPVQSTIKTNTFTMHGDILINKSTVGDSISFYGTFAENTGTFILDVNFETKVSDTINLQNATFKNTINVLFQPQNPLYYATIGTILPDVIQLPSNTITPVLVQTDVGGYVYKLVQSEQNADNWNLQLVSISATNYAYAGVIENMRNYSRDVWDIIHDRTIQNALAEYGRSLNSIKPNVHLPKTLRQGNITAWATANYTTNSIYTVGAPEITTENFNATAGIGIYNIDINSTTTNSTDIFFNYGTVQSSVLQYADNREFDMDMTAKSVGIQNIFKNNSFGKAHTLVTSLATWGDFLDNTVNFEGLDAKTNWHTYAINASFSFGYMLNTNNISFFTSLTTLYAFTHGTNFITRSKNAIRIEDDHRLSLQLNALVGYTFNFGLTPFFQINISAPLYSKEKGVIYSNNNPFSYKSEYLFTTFRFGLNYSIQLDELAINAFFSLGGNKGEPGTTVEVGWNVTGGIEIVF